LLSQIVLLFLKKFLTLYLLTNSNFNNKLMNSKITKLLAIFICTSAFLFSAIKTNLTAAENNLPLDSIHTDSTQNKNLAKLYIALTAIGKGIDTTYFNESKIYAAINLIALLSEKYLLISPQFVQEKIEELKKPINAFDIANAVEADKILIIKIEQLKNIIRAEITSINPNPQQPIQLITNEGFAAINFFENQTNIPVYDPTILKALQRAFALNENDSLMFMELPQPFSVKPVPNLVISGMEFQNDLSFTSWDVFSEQLVRSYEFSETIYDEIKNTDDWVVFDIDSRDAIYEMFNLFLVENNIAPSANEIAALMQFSVNHFISGKIERNRNGITISLTLNNINQQNEIVPLKSVSENIYTNDVKKTKEAIKELAQKILAD